MHIRAVVTAVPNLVFVVVELTGVEEKLAVVLAGSRENVSTPSEPRRTPGSTHCKSHRHLPRRDAPTADMTFPAPYGEDRYGNVK